MRPGTPTAALPARLRVAGFVLPTILIALLIALDYFVLGPALLPGLSHLVLLVIGIAGVVAFSAAIFARLTELHRRDEEQTSRLREFAQALEERRAQLQALNVAGISLTSEHR